MAEVKSKYVDQRPPMVGGKYDLKTMTTKLLDVVFMRGFQKGWIVGFAAVFLGLLMMANTIAYLVLKGVGIWGNSSPVFWAFDIINFVWWIGIGHAGTLISAILLLLRQQWRNSINRFAEAMTLFAVACAAMFPALHTGRPWVDYWLFPIPNTMGMWQNFRSPLMWDVFAVNTYATVSLLFWFMGLIPDFATLRDSAKQPWQKMLFGMLSMGWRGDARHWSRYESAYLLLAGLSTPLVLSVHTIVSFDFSTGIVPGWHATIFPPYFVAGAVYAGFAMVLSIGIPVRKFYKLEDFITMRHIRNMCKVMLATGLIVCYGYAMEAFFGWYSGSTYEMFMMKNRMFGPYGIMYWLLILCNFLVPQLLWIKKYRENMWVIMTVCMFINVGMWLERFVIIVMSLNRDFLPSSWRMYYPTPFDFSMFFGTIGFFLTLMFLFIRFVPMIPIFEMKTLLPQAKVDEHKVAEIEEAKGNGKEPVGGSQPVPQFGD
ncbi:MAG TPA: polysulfide reductase NrfD [Blastocatellia bacterium]|nr:polysulfide reductase NrfD [Blastocatellia bacterium]